MNDSAETFRQGSTCSRNARDLAKKHRDEAIKGANEGTVEFQARWFTTSVGFGQAFSFACKAASDGAYTRTSTIEALSQVSRTSLTEDSIATTHLQESDNLSGGLLVDYWAQPSDRVKIQKESPHLQLTRHDASDSDYTLSRQLKLYFIGAVQTLAAIRKSTFSQAMPMMIYVLQINLDMFIEPGSASRQEESAILEL